MGTSEFSLDRIPSTDRQADDLPDGNALACNSPGNDSEAFGISNNEGNEEFQPVDDDTMGSEEDCIEEVDEVDEDIADSEDDSPMARLLSALLEEEDDISDTYSGSLSHLPFAWYSN
jgi:hypothetical protein